MGLYDRDILHVDLNAFYASVAQHLEPNLKGKPVAVAGDPKKRNGIILAKSLEAKACGVKTASAIWQAKAACPNIIIVPPDYSAYKRYSRLVRMIYYDYTNAVEPFGLDEAWLDITKSHARDNKVALEVAHEIKCRVKEETGLTVSVGVSWNKVFAKLGSDIDPSDGIVEITPANYKEVVWPLDAKEMIYVGPATERKLRSAGYLTIGDVAHTGDYFLKHRFGKIGFMLRSFARGEDANPVKEFNPDICDVEYDIKGIGNGLTAPHDLVTESDVKALVWLLSESVAQRLREAGLATRTISVGVRQAFDSLGRSFGYTRQTTLRHPTCLTKDIATTSLALIANEQKIDTEHPIRAIHVRTDNLSYRSNYAQRDLFGEVEHLERLEALDDAIDSLRARFGNNCVRRVCALTDDATKNLDIKRDNTIHPVGFLR